MDLFFSAAHPGFYPASDQVYYQSMGTWPEDAVQLTEEEIAAFWRQTPPTGKVLGSNGGRPAWVNAPQPGVLSEVEARLLRQQAYRAEADPLKLEAEYDALVNGVEPDLGPWMAKVAEIKQRYPLPE